MEVSIRAAANRSSARARVGGVVEFDDGDVVSIDFLDGGLRVLGSLGDCGCRRRVGLWG